MKYLLITIVLMLSPGMLNAADFNAGMAAYERGNYAAAAVEFSALAEAGDQHAQYMLGRLHAQGNGVLQDYVQAHKWYNLAAASGHVHAAQARDALARHMHTTQISQAQRQAGMWRSNADASAEEAPDAAPDQWSWRRLLHDSFQDGDYTRDPAWTVVAGQFRVEQGIGLRSVYEPREPPAATRTEDLSMAILGAIFGTDSSGESAAEAPDFAEIHVPRDISNAFNIRILLTLRQPAPGPLAFGPYQGSERGNGYRLAYTPGVSRGLHLVRLTGSGSSVLSSVDPQFRVNQQYNIQWTRDERRGEMAVSVEGNEVLRVTDSSLTGPFDGFTMINRGGDYALREIVIYGID